MSWKPKLLHKEKMISIIIKKQGDMLKESPKRAAPTIILQKKLVCRDKPKKI